jgi:carotenoid 1,2-hydratase
VAFRIFHKDHLVGEACQEFSHSFLKASDHQSAVLLGPNRFNWDAHGDPPSYVVTIQAPVRGGRKLLRARLFFTPQTDTIPTLPAPAIPSTHTWVLTAPLCHVEGTLQWCNAGGEVEKEQGFVGKGYHDHHWGSVPLDRFVKSWHWGRAFIGDKTLVYSVQTPQGENESSESIVAVFDKNRPILLRRDITTQLGPTRRNFFWLPFTKHITLADTFTLNLDHDTVLNDGPVTLIFKDKVEWKSGGEVLNGSGLSNYLYAPRLSSSFFFPMLKGKTTVYCPQEGMPPPPDPSGDVSTERPNL